MRRRLVLIVLGWIMQDYLNQSALQLLRKCGSIYKKKIDVGRKDLYSRRMGRERNSHDHELTNENILYTFHK